MLELMMKVEGLISEELERANKKFPLFRSLHEALAVTEEEVYEANEDMGRVTDALWDMKLSVFNDNYDPQYSARLELAALELACESIQVAAMARKFNMREEKE